MLTAIRILHTVVWAFFAACIVAIPLAAWHGKFRVAAWCSAIVLVEVLELMGNRWRCPLTSVAARHTPDRRDNFDIYLPLWLARYNKQVFGALYVGGMAFALVLWLRAAD